MHKLWVVLKVSLTRPWVWLMLLIGVSLLITTASVLLSTKRLSPTVAIPAFDQPDKMLSDQAEFEKLVTQNQLETIEGINTYRWSSDLQFAESEAGRNDGKAPSKRRQSVASDDGAWSVLERMPQLKALAMQPPNLLSAEGWRRIGQLSKLEVLSLERVGAADAEALKTSGSDLNAAIGKLTNLRQLNVQNTGGNFHWKLPPLPKLEYVALSYNLQLEQTLEALAEHSPNLHTIALFSFTDKFYTPRMIEAIRKMPRLQHVYIVASVSNSQVDETGKQVQWFKSQLPGISVHRGEYSVRRMMISLFLLSLCGFIPFVAWFQSGLTLSQPLAAIMPGHRGPHLFWPITISLVAVVIFALTAKWTGATASAAIAMGCMASFFGATILAGHDIRSDWRRLTRLLLSIDLLSLVLLIAIGVSAPTILDGFLLGDHPTLTNMLMIWFLGAVVWKITRATRLHRILAESGLPGIPGLNLGLSHMYDQPVKPSSSWSFAAWQLKRMERKTDRRIASMDRTNWTDMLRKALPANPGISMAIVMVVIYYLVFNAMTSLQNVQNPQSFAGTFGMMQAAMTVLMVSTMPWLGRRGSIAIDFLRPVGRPLFWQSLRMAIFHDLKFAFLLGLACGLFAIHQTDKGELTPFTIAIVVANTAGFCIFFHACVMLMVIGKRLWLHATLTVVASIALVAMMVCAAVMTFADEYEPMIAVLLTIVVLATGVLVQWGLARRLPNWELA